MTISYQLAIFFPQIYEIYDFSKNSSGLSSMNLEAHYY